MAHSFVVSLEPVFVTAHNYFRPYAFDMELWTMVCIFVFHWHFHPPFCRQLREFSRFVTFAHTHRPPPLPLNLRPYYIANPSNHIFLKYWRISVKLINERLHLASAAMRPLNTAKKHPERRTLAQRDRINWDNLAELESDIVMLTRQIVVVASPTRAFRNKCTISSGL